MTGFIFATGNRSWLPAVLLLATALRLSVAFATSLSFYSPDELFQYIEQAHRIDFGFGVVPWEYRFGIRSWVLPLLLAIPMRAGALLAPGSDLYLLLPKLATALFSTAVVWSAYVIAGRVSRLHAFVGSFVVAVWFDFILFAVHPLSESFSFATFMIGAALLLEEQKKPSKLAVAGFLFAFAAVVRFQYLPAIATFMIVQRLHWRHWLPLIAGCAAALAASALVDICMSQAPFAWLFENVRQNLVRGRSQTYGVAPPLAYLIELGKQWTLWTAVIVPLVIVGARRFPSLFIAATANLAFHMFIPHKEYRFIFLSAAVFIFLAAIGTAEALKAARRRWPDMDLALWTGAALAIWCGASISCALGRAVEWRWNGHAQIMETMEDARRLPELCGMGVYGIHFSQGISYTILHRSVPIYDIEPVEQEKRRALNAIAPFSNVLVASRDDKSAIPSEYHLIRCHSSTSDASRRVKTACLYLRDGFCGDGEPPPTSFEINEMLRRTGQ